jgi:hypothetical protein
VRSLKDIQEAAEKREHVRTRQQKMDIRGSYSDFRLESVQDVVGGADGDLTGILLDEHFLHFSGVCDERETMRALTA